MRVYLWSWWVRWLGWLSTWPNDRPCVFQKHKIWLYKWSRIIVDTNLKKKIIIQRADCSLGHIIRLNIISHTWQVREPEGRTWICWWRICCSCWYRTCCCWVCSRKCSSCWAAYFFWSSSHSCMKTEKSRHQLLHCIETDYKQVNEGSDRKEWGWTLNANI